MYYGPTERGWERTRRRREEEGRKEGRKEGRGRSSKINRTSHKG